MGAIFAELLPCHVVLVKPGERGDDLAAEQAGAPRVPDGDPDVGVGAVRLELEQVAELDLVDPGLAHHPVSTARRPSTDQATDCRRAGPLPTVRT